MNKKMIIILSIVFLAIVAFLFYWYEWRPAKIRAYCEWNVRWGDLSQGLTIDNYKLRYESCLHSKGIE